MTDFDREMGALLESAWQGASPAPRDLDRVEALVRERVAARGAAGPRDAPPDQPSTNGWPRLLPQAATAAERARLLGWGSLIASVAFLLGVGFGQARDTAARERAPIATPQPVVAHPAHQAPVSSAHTPPPSPPPAAEDSSAPETRAHGPGPRSHAAARTEVASTHASRTAAASTRTPPSARAEPSSRLGFDAVLALLERAERSLRRSEPAFALSLLDDIDARADAQTLHDERLITRVLAACALGDIDAARRARARLESGSGSASIYASRLSESCVARPAHPIEALGPAPALDRSDPR